MALSDTIILNKGQVLLQQIDTNVILLNNTNLQFGEVALVSDLSDRYKVGDDVLYNPKDSTSITVLSTEYSLVTEDNIFFSAVLVAP